GLSQAIPAPGWLMVAIPRLSPYMDYHTSNNGCPPIVEERTRKQHPRSAHASNTRNIHSRELLCQKRKNRSSPPKNSPPRTKLTFQMKARTTAKRAMLFL